ncbi:MAG: hypothetical protein ACK4FJ_10205 [Ferrovibrio sp.]|uniref:hypothetical protein n=1 Tax=Ferrovibrio sp. TaxID=1917215 RepID=UPI00391B7041
MLCGGILAGLVSAWLRLWRHSDPAAPKAALAAAFCSLLILAAAAHGVWAYGYGIHRQAQQPRPLLGLGEIALGPWRMQVNAVGDERIEFRPVEAGLPNLRRAVLNGVAMRGAGAAFWAPMPAGCAMACSLRIEAEQWNGTRHVAVFDIAPAAARRRPLPVATDWSMGERLLLVPALFGLLLPLLFWLWLLWPAALKAGRARTIARLGNPR